MMRWVAIAACVGALAGTAGCQDLREFTGTWNGDRVGDEAVRRGFAEQVNATLEIEYVDLRTLEGRLSTNDDRFARTPIAPIGGAEADVLSTMTFEGSPVRVFLSFAEASDGGGDALVMIALYSDDRIELRAMRGGTSPLYGVFTLRHTGD